MSSFLRKVPGFRSDKWWKVLIASGFYLFAFLTTLAILFPSAPTLALEKIDPTSKSSVSIAGKTYSNKPVYLLKDNEVIRSIKSDSGGKFYFPLNNLTDGNYTYAVEACNSEKKDKCRSENILIVVDQTPPAKPVIALPDKLPDDSEKEIVIKGVSEPNAKIIASVQNGELSTTAANDKGEFEIKTGLVLGTNTINVKAVDNVGNESAVGGASLDFNPSRYKTKVIRVIDGDTIKIEGDKIVRYIGIDTPETVHPSKPVQCYGKEASDKNKELVEGKEVNLEKDIS
ncbi:thermonuclease family protein, partial [Patescibacteria group bacterium]|nr:thermonuclease family protein [Patescibacteria group bacterium]